MVGPSPPRNMRLCQICLEQAPDEPPPCQRLEAPCFHRRCLEMTWAAQAQAQRPPACPHCNMPLPTPPPTQHPADLGRHALEGVLSKWLQRGGFWVQPPQYVPAKQGLMAEVEGRAVLASWREAILPLLPWNMIEEHQQGAEAFAASCADPDTSTRITVRLLRVAVVNALGSFLQDGFAVTAERRKHLPPRRRSLRCLLH